MSNLVPVDQIERIVGAQRHPVTHIGRAVSAEETTYILHSKACKDSGIDLRMCKYSLALDQGIDLDVWRDRQDEAVPLAVRDGRLVPVNWIVAQ